MNMVFNINTQICGLIVVFFIAGFYFKKRTGWIQSDRVFSYMLVNTILCLLFDIASVFTINFRAYIPGWLNALVCKCYLISLILVGYFTILYVYAQIFVNMREYIRKFRKTTVFIGISLIPYIFLPIEYYVNKEDYVIYSDGPAVLYTYALCVILLTIGFTILLKRARKVSAFRRRRVEIVLLTFTVAGLIQFVYNQLLIISFVGVIEVLNIYFFMENPFNKLDKDAEILNLDMMKQYISDCYERGSRFYVIALNIRNFDNIKKVFGFEKSGELIIDFVKRIDNIKDVKAFRISENKFAVVGMYDNSSFNDTFGQIEEIEKMDFNISNVNVNIDAELCILNESFLLGSSDEVLYYINHLFHHNKNNKRIQIIDTKSIKDVKQVQTIKKTIRWALQNDMFEVYYQPIYSISKNRFVSAEALVRLWDEDGNYISPEDFITIAEQDGMIVKLGMMIIEKVCRFIKKYKPGDLGIEYIEVNLSVVQCMQSTLASDLKEIIDRYGIPLDYIRFEITETAMITSKNSLMKNISALRTWGSEIYLDDFGTGYANLNNLVELPFKATKLDKELVWSYFSSEKGKIATISTINMLKRLDMEIVAEGIETEEQLREMKNLGIEYIQGFYFNKPINGRDFIEFIKQSIEKGVNIGGI